MSPPAAAPAVRARTHAPPRPLAPLRGPRRISGPLRPSRPARPDAPARTAPPAGAGYGGLVLGALELVQRVSSHRLLDRLIRGRAWIVLVAFALLGIVTLQLALLKLNTGIGRSLERAAVLQNQNAAISIEDSELAAGGRVEETAARLGMTVVPDGMLAFLAAHPRRDAARAASVLSAPLQSAAVSETAPAASSQPEGAGSEAGGGESSSSSAAGGGEAASSASAASSAEGESTPATAGGEEGASPSSSSPSGSSEASSSGEAAAGGGTQASPTG
jgi:hypothetical protein